MDIDDIPEDCLWEILRRATKDFIYIFWAGQVCRRWRDLCFRNVSVLWLPAISEDLADLFPSFTGAVELYLSEANISEELSELLLLKNLRLLDLGFNTVDLYYIGQLTTLECLSISDQLPYSCVTPEADAIAALGALTRCTKLEALSGDDDVMGIELTSAIMNMPWLRHLEGHLEFASGEDSRQISRLTALQYLDVTATVMPTLETLEDDMNIEFDLAGCHQLRELHLNRGVRVLGLPTSSDDLHLTCKGGELIALPHNAKAVASVTEITLDFGLACFEQDVLLGGLSLSSDYKGTLKLKNLQCLYSRSGDDPRYYGLLSRTSAVHIRAPLFSTALDVLLSGLHCLVECNANRLTSLTIYPGPDTNSGRMQYVVDDNRIQIRTSSRITQVISELPSLKLLCVPEECIYCPSCLSSAAAEIKVSLEAPAQLDSSKCLCGRFSSLRRLSIFPICRKKRLMGTDQISTAYSLALDLQLLRRSELEIFWTDEDDYLTPTPVALKSFCFNESDVFDSNVQIRARIYGFFERPGDETDAKCTPEICINFL